MNPPPMNAEALSSDTDLLSLDGESVLRASHIHDRPLLLELEMAQSEGLKVYSSETKLYFVNPELAKRAKAEYGADEADEMEQFLADKGTTDIPIVKGYSVMIDGVRIPVWMVAATEIGADGANHGDMSSMLYLRDQVQAASALMELSLRDPNRYATEAETAKELLVSALHLMSTPSQLERFENVIRLGSEAGQADWPQISLHFNDLEGNQPNGWRNKQDSFQMLAYTTLDAIDRGFLSTDELSDAHKQFLASIVPLLESVGFPRYESSGSWEENESMRTSVTAVETVMLHKMKTLIDHGVNLDFLYGGDRVGFQNVLDNMIDQGLREISQRLPFESPDYDQDSIKFRQADAALIYVLRYDLPQLLADRQIPIAIRGNTPGTAEEIEDMVLEQLRTLIDQDTNAVIRYPKDSYQGLNFHSETIQSFIKAIKQMAKRRDGTTDLDKKQALREQLTPDGRPAAWTHPLSQIASWAANRAIATRGSGEADRYRQLSTQFINMALSTVTADNQWNAVLNGDNRYHLKRVPAYKLPECYVAYQSPTGKIFHVPSPHTPLNWSSAMLREAVGLLRIASK